MHTNSQALRLAADRQLLLALLALHVRLLERESLLLVLREWTTDRMRPLLELVQQRQLLSSEECDALMLLLGRLLDRHNGDISECMTELSINSATREELRALGLIDLMPTVLMSPSGLDPTLETNDTPRDRGDGSDAQGCGGMRPRFAILRHHASGGLGTVSLAYDRELKREVALKEIRAEHAGKAISQTRFVLEAEITGSLEHPGIVPVYALGKGDDGQPYYVMRFIAGQSLRESIEQFHLTPHRNASERSLALRQLLRHFVDICNTIDFAHSKRVLHRDLKPANVMIGTYGETLVVDWGMAKRLGAPELPADAESPTVADEPKPGLTIPGMALGTPAYMSPEQAAGRTDVLTPASDIYSLGATLYCLLTGLAPFIDRSPRNVLEKVQRGDFLPPRAINRAIAPALDAICRKAMALRPEERYGRARELADDVERWLADEPVRAFREGFIWRVRRWRRRHRTLTTSGLLLFVALVLGTTVGGFLFQQQRQKQRATSYVKNLPLVNSENARFILEDLPRHRAEATPLLWEKWHDPMLSDVQRLRIGMGLAREDPQIRLRLLELARTTDDPAEIALLAEVLAPYAVELREPLWTQLDRLPAAQRFHLLALLATLDPEAPRWTPYLDATAEALLAANPLHFGEWALCLAPLSERLLPALTRHFRDSPDAERRRLVATVLLNYARLRPDVLADLLLDADDGQWAVLWPKLQGEPEKVTPVFEREFKRELHWSWADATPLPPPVTLDAAVRSELSLAEGIVHERFVLCPRLPRERLHAVAAALQTAGYRPLRLRLHAQAGKLYGAGLWVRDERPGDWCDDLTRQQAEERIAALKTQGFHPCELSLVPGAMPPRYVLCWTRADPSIATVRPFFDHGEARALEKKLAAWQKEDFRPLTHSTTGTGAERQHAGLWVKYTGLPERHFPLLLLSPAEFDRAVTTSMLQCDVDAGSGGHVTSIWKESASYVSCCIVGTLQQHTLQSQKLADQNWRPAACTASLDASGQLQVRSVWHHPVIPDAAYDRRARRQAQAAIALLLLGQPQHTWGRLQPTPDPRCRTWLLHRFKPLGVKVDVLLAQLRVETTPAKRAALVLALGSYPLTAIPLEVQQQIAQWYETDPDRGLHGACEWLLRRWQQDEVLAAAESRLKGKPPAPGCQWSINGQGQTLVQIAGGEFEMGSPSQEEGRLVTNEALHRIRIPRSFALASKEVTVDQFRLFRPEHTFHRYVSPYPDGPMTMVSWYDAAEYCNWLSEQEKIPRSEWCYLPNAQGKYGPGMKLADNYLERSGYRLPTEAEWEFACRAGTVTPWHFGSAESLLPEYAWYAQGKVNAGVERGGRHRPNDWGLFDMHGNVVEWCMEATLTYRWPDHRGDGVDHEHALVVDDQETRLLRGGSFNFLAVYLRSARHFGNNPGNNLDSSGVRVARTLKPH